MAVETQLASSSLPLPSLPMIFVENYLSTQRNATLPCSLVTWRSTGKKDTHLMFSHLEAKQVCAVAVGRGAIVTESGRGTERSRLLNGLPGVPCSSVG